MWLLYFFKKIKQNNGRILKETAYSNVYMSKKKDEKQ